jgi:hypothetical protein
MTRDQSSYLRTNQAIVSVGNAEPRPPSRGTAWSTHRRSVFVRQIVLLVWAAAVAYGIFSAGDNDLWTTETAAGLFGLVVWPGLRYASTGNGKYLIVGFLSLLNYMYFVLPFVFPDAAFAGPFMGAHFDRQDTEFILLFAGAFIFLFEIGYLASSSGQYGTFARRVEDTLFYISYQIPTYSIVLLMCFCVVALNYHLQNLIPQALVFLRQIVVLGVPFGLVAMFLRPRPKWAWIISFGVIYPLYYVIQISSGFLASWVFANAIVALGYALVRRRMPWIPFVVVIASTLPLMPAKDVYRMQHWAEQSSETGLEGGFQYLATALQFGGETQDIAIDLRNRQAVARAAMGPIVFSRVIAYHEQHVVDFQYGATFWDLPLSFFPRFLAPWKPEKNTGQWFGHSYGFLLPWDDVTSVNLPPVVESYVNFGIAGPILGLLLGAVCGWLSRLLGHARSPMSALATVVVFSGFVNSESGVSIVYGQALQMLVMMWALVWWTQLRAVNVARTKFRFVSTFGQSEPD